LANTSYHKGRTTCCRRSNDKSQGRSMAQDSKFSRRLGRQSEIDGTARQPFAYLKCYWCAYIQLRDIKTKGGYIVDWFNLWRGKTSGEVDQVKLSITYLPLLNGVSPDYTVPVDTSALYKCVILCLHLSPSIDPLLRLTLDKLVAYDSLHSKSVRAFAEKKKQHGPYLSKSSPSNSPRSSIEPDDNNDDDVKSDPSKVTGRDRTSSASDGIQNRSSNVDLSQNASEILQWFAKGLNIPAHRVDLMYLLGAWGIGLPKTKLAHLLELWKCWPTWVTTSSIWMKFTAYWGYMILRSTEIFSHLRRNTDSRNSKKSWRHLLTTECITWCKYFQDLQLEWEKTTRYSRRQLNSFVISTGRRCSMTWERRSSWVHKAPTPLPNSWVNKKQPNQRIRTWQRIWLNCRGWSPCAMKVSIKLTTSSITIPKYCQSS